MTNQSISVLLTHLSSVARDPMCADPEIDSPLPGVTQVGAEAAYPGENVRLEKVLRVLDDLQELVSETGIEGGDTDRFDAVQMVAEVAQLMNLVAARGPREFVRSGNTQSCWLVQNRATLDYALMRVCQAALSLSVARKFRIAVEPNSALPGVAVSLTMTSRQEADTMAHWLTADVGRASFSTVQEVAAAIALMVAGRRLRLMRCRITAAQTGEHWRLVIDVPTLQIEPEQASASAVERADRLRVLVAEDFDESFHLTAMALEDEMVERARDGWEALRLLRRHRYDLILMDIHMPGLDGYSTIRAIREWETEAGKARTPIIILSSDGIETQRRAAALAGCSGFLRKPLCNEELREIVARVRFMADPPTSRINPGSRNVH